MFATEIQTVYQMKDIIHSYFLLESDFEITFKKSWKIFFWKGCVEKHTLQVLKGLRLYLVWKRGLGQ